MQATGAAEDWITIWESEFACLADDVELREAWLASVALWASQARDADAWLAPVPRDETGPAGPATAGTQAGPAPPAAPPDAGLAPDSGLAGIVAELERRLAVLAGPTPRT